MTIEEIYKQIRARGFKLTKTRQAIITLLFNACPPLSATNIALELKKNKINKNRTTIYRELCFLLKHKIANKIQLGENNPRYEISSEHHHHVICLKCGVIKEVVLDKHLYKQEEKIYRENKFKVLSHSLEFFGLCAKCQ